MTIEYQVALPSISLPREGCYRPGNDLVRLKVELGGNCVVSVPDPAGSGTSVTRTGGSALGASVSREIEAGLVRCEASGGVELDMADVAEAFSGMNQREIAAKCFEAISVGLSREFTLRGTDDSPTQRRAELGTEASFDSDLCFFAANIGLTSLRRMRIESSLVEASIAVSCQLRFGPGLRVYSSVGRRMGMPVVEQFLTRIIPRAILNQTLLGLFRAAGIWAFAIEAGYDMMRLSQWICRTAYQRGVRRGQAQVYAQAYIRTVYMGHYQVALPSASHRAGVEQARRDVHHLGYLLLRQRLEERYNPGKPFRFDQDQQFLRRDTYLPEMINRFAAALDAGAPGSLRD